jgi:hypothetical protein
MQQKKKAPPPGGEVKNFPGQGKTLNQLSTGGQRTMATKGVIKAQQ